jgi:hypothetical protein
VAPSQKSCNWGVHLLDKTGLLVHSFQEKARAKY